VIEFCPIKLLLFLKSGQYFIILYLMISKAIEIIKKSSQPGKTISRDTVIFKQLMNLLDHPYKHFKSIHITGTNGKGSATIKLATALQHAGYKTGMYTSPHIFQFL
jgi:folylpolyglutamate synthase/dihydropteroate synthase